MYMPINPLGYSCIKKLQRDNLLHAYNEPINIYSVVIFPIITQRSYEQLNPICGFQRGKLTNKKVTQLDYQITTNSSSQCIAVQFRARPDWAYEFPDRTGPDTKICRTESGLIFLNILSSNYRLLLLIR